MLLSEDSPFPMREAYKSLRTNVMFSIPGSDSKCIGIVSANRGEGKSTIAINLAISFAQANKKVIVVDCDMRLPTVAAKIGINATPGLSNYLAGNDEIKGTFDPAAKETSDFEQTVAENEPADETTEE